MAENIMVQDGPDTPGADTAAEAMAALRAELDAQRATAAAGGRDAAVLAHLADTLRWDGAPRALQAVLPLARLLRRVCGGARLHAGVADRGMSKRMVLRLYLLTRPVSLPLARRMHRLLGRLLEKDGMLSQRDAATDSAVAPATAQLMHSIEAAMLTLALQRRGEGP
jgi:hypothetical protein